MILPSSTFSRRQQFSFLTSQLFAYVRGSILLVWYGTFHLCYPLSTKRHISLPPLISSPLQLAGIVYRWKFAPQKLSLHILTKLLQMMAFLLKVELSDLAFVQLQLSQLFVILDLANFNFLNFWTFRYRATSTFSTFGLWADVKLSTLSSTSF